MLGGRRHAFGWTKSTTVNPWKWNFCILSSRVTEHLIKYPRHLVLNLFSFLPPTGKQEELDQEPEETKCVLQCRNAFTCHACCDRNGPGFHNGSQLSSQLVAVENGAVRPYCSVSVLQLPTGIQQRVKGKRKRGFGGEVLFPRENLEDGNKAGKENGNGSRTPPNAAPRPVFTLRVIMLQWVATIPHRNSR